MLKKISQFEKIWVEKLIYELITSKYVYIGVYCYIGVVTC